MKTQMKGMSVVVTLLFALTMMAQTATQTAPAAPADKTSTCPCCSDKCPMGNDGKMADGKSCCNNGCCKDGKCDMAAHKGHTMASGKSCCAEGCCKDGKCDTATHKSGKGCCGDKCPMMKKGDKVSTNSCCAPGAACCQNGTMGCCSRPTVAVNSCCGGKAAA